MRIHHLNCGSLCPLGGAWMDGRSRGLVGHLVCHCLLVETRRHGLVLVDTGFGGRDVAARRPPLFFRAILRMRLDPAETALAQLRALGHRPEDVRHIVLTHLDFDHAGGLDDFPAARVHLLAAEARAAHARSGFIGRRRWRPEQWGDESRWRVYSPGGSEWMGFDCVRDLDGLPPDILLVPLAGHTPGHAGIAVDTGAGWLLHAGDAYFHHREMDPERPRCTPGLALYQRMMEVDRKARLSNQDRLRRLARDHAGTLRLVCSHDASEFQATLCQGPGGAL